MNEQEAYDLIKDELSHYVIFTKHDSDIAERILDKIQIYIKEEEYLHRENRLKRIISYRLVSIISEYLIVLVVTGNYVYGLITTPICIIIHSFLHYLVERWFR